ncbi:MAG: glycosyltransferase [Alphaproteobacteria bacterium]|nr:glycosyltransferase [Alphaproteobacteria bacterium]
MTAARLQQASQIAAGCVASADPLVTVSKRETDLPAGLASLKPEYFESKPSLHFIGLTWSAEINQTASTIAKELAAMRERLPKAHFVMMASTPSESVAFSNAGVANLLANELIFVDERLFTPTAHDRRNPQRFDAAYTARLCIEKRHELAAAVPRVVLLYGRTEAAEIERTKQLLPRAVFANHELNGGVYRFFDETHIREMLGRCSVGLCLSAEEGAMRASLEYRLCGLPVVSTQSVGGRDRYLLGPHVRIVDDNPQAVADAVAELKSLQFHPLAVREFVGQLVAFDRHNFLLNANKIVERELGVRDRFRSFEPFLRYPVTWRPSDQVFAPLMRIGNE